MPGIVYNVGSSEPDIDALLASYRWATDSLTFSFPTRPTQYSGYEAGSEPDSNFEALNAAQRAAARHALGGYAAVANLDFTEVAGGAGDLRFGMTDASETAHAYLPADAEYGGDSWYRNTGGDFDSPHKGNYAYFAFMHEVGHALGLKHPHEADRFGTMSAAHDQVAYSVMSYRSYRGESPNDGYTNQFDAYPQSLMMLDIAALQHLYGANFDHNAGDTVYSWNRVTGEMSLNGVGQGKPVGNIVFLTVWDGGGEDTLDLSNYFNPLAVDLRPGGWTKLGGQWPHLGGGSSPGNVATALLFEGDPRALLENALGGLRGDVMIGNDAVNRLSGGDGDDDLTGGLGDDVLLGELGNDRLTGGAGADVLIGGAGSDYYWIDRSDEIVEAMGGDGDAVYVTWGNYTLPDNIETVIGQGRLAAGLFGNAYDNGVHGSAHGIIDGGAGADNMSGAHGRSNSYYVDNVGDTVRDAGGGGRDVVYSSVSFTLVDFIDRLVLTGADAIDGTGTVTNDDLIGNVAANTLTGGWGADRLDGGGGADRLVGGAWHDVYRVDDSGDTIVELADEGIDSVESRIGFTLAAHVENLELIGTRSVDGTGNTLSNILIGNSGANRLDGRSGNDRMAGGAGDDEYVVSRAGDIVTEAAASGIDTVISVVSYTLGDHVERLELGGRGSLTGRGNSLDNEISGASGADLLFGGNGRDLIEGGAGDDRLFGGDGRDSLAGGRGADRFYFDARLGAQPDLLLDFDGLEDSVFLDRAVFDAIAPGRVGSDAFCAGRAATDAGHRIVYDRVTGAIFYDADGSGAGEAVLFCRVDPQAQLSASDFTIYG